MRKIRLPKRVWEDFKYDWGKHPLLAVSYYVVPLLLVVYVALFVVSVIMKGTPWAALAWELTWPLTLAGFLLLVLGMVAELIQDP